MAQEITVEDLQKKQSELERLAEQLQRLDDGGAIAAMAPRLEAVAKELQEMAKTFEQQQLAKHGPPVQAKTVVVLTPAQRWRIKAELGVDLEEVAIDDTDGVVAGSMPLANPRLIEFWARRAAEQKKTEEEAKRLLKAQLESLFEILELQSPALAEKVGQLKRDPQFMPGLVDRK